jgi:hypothetical protein
MTASVQHVDLGVMRILTSFGDACRQLADARESPASAQGVSSGKHRPNIEKSDVGPSATTKKGTISGSFSASSVHDPD